MQDLVSMILDLTQHGMQLKVRKLNDEQARVGSCGCSMGSVIVKDGRMESSNEGEHFQWRTRVQLLASI